MASRVPQKGPFLSREPRCTIREAHIHPHATANDPGPEVWKFFLLRNGKVISQHNTRSEAERERKKQNSLG